MKKNQNIEKKISDNLEPPPSKKKRYCVKFNDSLKNLGQVKILFCVLCVETISVLHMDKKIILIDTRTPEKIRDMWILRNHKKLTNFGASSAIVNLDQKVMKSKLLFSCFLVEHDLPLTTADNTAKLFRNMFRDSKIVNKYRCGRTKTIHMLAGAV